MRLRHAVAATVVTLSSIAACGSDDGSAQESESAKLGPECEKYYGSGNCCLDVAGDQAQAKDACVQGKKSIEEGLKKGGKPADFEAACKTANDTAKLTGKCSGGGDGGTHDGGGADAAVASLGPACEHYFGTGGCCLEVGLTPSEDAECEKSRKELEDAIKQGQDPNDFEDACQQGIDSAQSGGRCQSS